MSQYTKNKWCLCFDCLLSAKDIYLKYTLESPNTTTKKGNIEFHNITNQSSNREN